MRRSWCNPVLGWGITLAVCVSLFVAPTASAQQPLPTPPSPTSSPLTATSPEIQAKVEADQLYADAQTALSAGDVQVAIYKWETAAAIYRGIDDRLSEGDCYLQVAPLYMTLGDFQTAMERYLQAFVASAEVYETLIVEAIPYDEETIAQGDALCQEGRALLDQGEYATALEKFVQARAVYQSIGYGVGELRAIVGQMEVHFARQNYLAALPLALEAILIADSLPPGSPTDQLYVNGLYQYEAGDLQGAIATWEQVVELYVEEKDLSGEAITRSNLGNAYATLGRYDEALAQYDLALPIFVSLEDQANEATVRHNLGNVYTITGRYQEALAAYEQALALWQALGERVNEAATQSGLGLVYREMGELDQALALFQAALDIQVRFHDRAGEADSYNNIGYVHLTRSDYDAALSHFEQAITIWQEMGMSLKVAGGLSNLGSVYATTGRYPEALQSYQQALAIQEEAGDLGGQASTLANMASVQLQWGDYQSALRLYQQSRPIFQATGNPLGEGNVLANIGAAYLKLGDLEQAREYVGQARELFQEIGSPERQAMALNNLGLITMQQGSFAGALAYYQAALQIWRKLDNAAGQAAVLGNVGACHLLKGEPELALAALPEATALAQKAGDPLLVGRLGSFAGFACSQLGQYDQARQQYERALAAAQSVGDPAGELVAYAGLGSVAFAQGDPEAAFGHLQQAVALLEGLQGMLTVEELKASFAGQFADVYELMVLVALALDRPQDAFGYAERGRARAFLDQLSNPQVTWQQAAEDELSRREMELRAQIRALEAQQRQERAKAQGARDSTREQNLTHDLEMMQSEYEALLVELKLQNPEYAGLVVASPLTLAQVQAALEPSITLVEYVVTDEQVVAFIITRQDFQAIELDVTWADLEQAIRGFRAFPNLERPHPDSLVNLYRWLWVPLYPFIHTETVGIVPHAGLHYLPFAALSDGERYLLRDYTFFYLPSASVLPAVLNRRKTSADIVLALGAPQVEGKPALYYATQEVQSIAGLYDTRALTGTAATESQVWALADNLQVLHLAAHGELNPHNPLFSTLHLASDERNDGRLEVHELYRLRLPQADLVTLSACESQLGHLTRGDEWIGLTRAFMYAGTPSVVASLWEVNDAATARLMTAFYTHLRKGLSKAAALRQAQVETLADNPHPWHWAAFTLVGDYGIGTSNVTVAPGEPSETDVTLPPPTEEATEPGRPGLCGGAAIILAGLAFGVWHGQRRAG